MSVIGDQKSEPSSGKTNTVNFNSTHSVLRELDSLSTASSSESIADESDIGKHSKTHDFVTLLQSDARLDVLDALQNVEVTDESETKQIRDERKRKRIELAETTEEFYFRRIISQTPDGKEIESLTTLASSAYDPIDISIRPFGQ